MPRRVSMPGADELFRPTAKPAPDSGEAAPEASGRVRHDEKMTIYLTSDELLAIEQARMTLRAAHGLKVDRGRFVRAALAEALADLETHGAEAGFVTRLTPS